MRNSRTIIGRLVTGLAALGYFATAWIHSTGFDSITALAAEGPEEMAGLAPALWLAFSLDLIVLGLVIVGAALRRDGPVRPVIAVAALCPFGAAALQLRYIGFIPPTGILLTIGTLALLGALLTPGRPVRSTAV